MSGDKWGFAEAARAWSKSSAEAGESFRRFTEAWCRAFGPESGTKR